MGELHEAQRMKWRVDDFHRMGQAGVIAPGARVELIDGAVFEMAPIGPWHADRVNRLTRLLASLVGPDIEISVQTRSSSPSSMNRSLT